MRPELPRVNIGTHALRHLPLLSIAEADLDVVIEQRRPQMLSRDAAYAVFMACAIQMGFRHVDSWTILRVVTELGW